jgi:uncharacterized C2H2 Zn-finger protein
MPEIIESFEWATGPEFKVVDAGKNTIRIKGVALKGDAISKNHRKYVVDELKRSARTWVGKPITINHDPKRIVGNLTWMEFSDESNALEYMGDINKQPYVNMLRDKSTEIRGVSVEAAYLHNRCPKCNMRFYSEQDFQKHMHDEHFIETDPTREPHGILGTALSLVLAPEEPGYADTTIQVMETVQTGFSRLVEILIKEKKEDEQYLEDKLSGKAALSEETHIAIGKATKMTMPTSTHGLVEANTPIQTTQKEPVVTEPKVAEVKPTPPAKENLKIAEPCSPELKACVDALIADGKEESSAWAICKAKLGETVTPSKTIILKEAVAIGKLVFNPKELYVPKGTSPEEYNRVFSETKQQNDSDKIVVDTVNEIIDVVSKPMSVTFPEIHIPKDDTSWKETIANLPKDDTLWKEELSKKADAESVNKELAETKALLAKKADAEPLIKELADTRTVLAKTTENLGKLDETVISITKKYEAIVKLSETTNAKNDKTFAELTTELTKAHEENEKLKTQVKESEAKKVKETAELEVRVDNVEDKLKPNFKGKQSLEHPSSSQHPVNPVTGAK